LLNLQQLHVGIKTPFNQPIIYMEL